jgi:type IV secretory pathway VirB9-like protein
MGFASKLEDETERRGGEAPRPVTHRLAYVFNAYGVTKPTEPKPTLQFDEDAEAKLGEILKRLEQAHQRKMNAFSALEGNPQIWGVGKALKSHKAFASDIDALVMFLVPYVRQMQGTNRRSWNRKIEKLKEAQYL